jgi:putative ABC transport system substrate-binding protein
MQRRDFIAVLSIAVAWPLAVQAQQPKKVALIGYLATGSLETPETRASFEAFRQGLRELGYFDGENIGHRGPSGGLENGTVSGTG